jgi:hypothetical protein
MTGIENIRQPFLLAVGRIFIWQEVVMDTLNN